jgi:hypothetical protein
MMEALRPVKLVSMYTALTGTGTEYRPESVQECILNAMMTNQEPLF